MNCPKCGAFLQISNAKGVEIDFCPNCRGVWLDRGELEKIIERSNEYYQPQAGYSMHNDRHEKHDYHHDNHFGYGHNSKHKKGFFSELFDF